MIPDASSFLDAPAWLLGLVDAATRVTLLLFTAGVLAFGLQRAAANVRHFVWHLAIVSCLVLPLATVVLPRLEWKVLPTREPALERLSPPAMDLPSRSSAPRRSQWAAWSDLNTMPDVPSGWTRAEFADDPAPTSSQAETVSGFSLPKLRLDQWLMLVWLAGVILVLEWMVVDRVRVFFLSQRAREVSDERRDVFLQQVLRLGVQGPVRFVEADIELPMTWGVIDPTVAVPFASREWPEERLEAVLLHELAHVRRRDTFTQLLAQLACAAYWFHPMVWFAARQLRVLREYACDDEVINHGVRPSSYAEELIQLVENVRRRDSLSGATLGMARRSHFKERLLAMLDPSVRRARLGKPRAWSMAALALIFTASLVVVQPAAAESPPATLPRLTPKQSAKRQVTAPPEALAPLAPVAPAPAPAPRLPRLAAPAAPEAPEAPEFPEAPDTEVESGEEAAVRAKIDAAVRTSKDDAALATALKRIAHEEELDEEATRQAFLAATARLNDELARWVALEALLVGAPISEQTGAGIMKEARRFSRDAERIAFLHRMHTIREDELVRGPFANDYLEIAAKLQSQEALSDALRELLHPSPVEQAAVERALGMASALDGDLLAPVLIEVTDHQAIAGNVQTLYGALANKLGGEQMRDAIERYNDAIEDDGKLWKKFAWNNGRVKVNVRDYQRKVQEAAREAAREAREAAREAREEAREAREEALRAAEERRRELEENRGEYARQLEQLRREKEKLRERAEQLKNEALELDSAMKALKKNLERTPEADVEVDVEVD